MREERERGVGGTRVKMIGSRRTLHPPGNKGERDEESERGEGAQEEREERKSEQREGGWEGLVCVSREARYRHSPIPSPYWQP